MQAGGRLGLNCVLRVRTLDQMVAWLKSGAGEDGGQIVSEERKTPASGLEVARIQSSSPRGDGVTLIAKVNDMIVWLGGGGTDLSRFDEAALTLRAVEAAR